MVVVFVPVLLSCLSPSYWLVARRGRLPLCGASKVVGFRSHPVLEVIGFHIGSFQSGNNPFDTVFLGIGYWPPFDLIF